MNPQRANRLYPKVGDLDGRGVSRWDPTSKCTESCEIYEDCPYGKVGLCTLERNYMNNIFNNLISANPERGIADQLSDIELQRVGIHLIPLYHQLIRMKKEAYAVKQMVHENKQGTLKVHPIFAEIRDVIKCISREMHDLKINEKFERKYGRMGGLQNAGGAQSIEELLEQGDPGFYDKLSEVDGSDKPNEPDTPGTPDKPAEVVNPPKEKKKKKITPRKPRKPKFESPDLPPPMARPPRELKVQRAPNVLPSGKTVGRPPGAKNKTKPNPNPT